MSEFKFKPEMFDELSGDGLVKEFAAKLSQAALDQHLKTRYKIYGYCAELEGEIEWFMSTLEESENTHEAYLFNLRPIEKTECEHDPVVELEKTITSATIGPGKVGYSFWSQSKWWCTKCGVKLKAKWEAVKE